MVDAVSGGTRPHRHSARACCGLQVRRRFAFPLQGLDGSTGIRAEHGPWLTDAALWPKPDDTESRSGRRDVAHPALHERRPALEDAGAGVAIVVPRSWQ